MSTVVSKFRSRAAAQQDDLALIFLQDGERNELKLTFGELDQRARAIAGKLQDLGATGERALLLYAPGVDYIAAFFGCLYAGVVAVPAYPPDPSRLQRSLPRLLATVADSRCKFLLTTTLIASMGQAMLELAPVLREMTWVSSDAVAPSLADTWRLPSVSGSDVAFLQYTSGSTGNPRGVMLTHQNLLHNLTLIASSLGLQSDTIGVSWLPPYHDMGLIGAILCPLIHGGPLTLMSPLSFLQRPLRWLQAISNYGAAASGGPNFAYDLCVRRVSAEDASQLDLSRWRTAFTGAEPIRRDTLEAFAKHFAVSGFKSQSFYPCYGLAEATLIVAGGALDSGATVFSADSNALMQNFVLHAADAASATPIVGCGRVLGNQSLVIVDPARSLPVPDASVGEIWVAGPSMAPGYWERSEESLGTFRAYLTDGSGPFLRTGDLGFLRNGELFITGRLKDLIIIRGANHYPQDIERTVEACHARIRKGCTVAFSFKYDADEHVVVVAEVERREPGARAPTDSASAMMDTSESPLVLEEIITSVRAAVTLQHQLQVHAVVLIEARTLPKTSSGKVQRHATRAAYMARTLSELTRSEVKLEGAGRSTIRPANTLELIKLAERDKGIILVTMVLVGDIARTLNVRRSQIDPARPVNSFGLDSLLSVELTHALERSLGVVFPATHFLRDASLKDLAAALYDLVVDEAGPPSSAGMMPASSVRGHLLSRGQAALWLMHSMGAGAAYNLTTAFRVRSAIDIEHLRQSFNFVAERHEILRTTYQADEAGSPKVAGRSAPLLFEAVDASKWSDEQIRERAQERANAPFDLENGPIMRVCLLSRGATEHVLVVALHHIAADLWSLVVLMSELGNVYASLTNGRVPPLKPIHSSYRTFVHWQEEVLSGPETYRSWNFWRNRFSTGIPVLELPTDRPRPRVQSFRGASQSVPIGSELSARVRALSRALSVTPYSVLLAAFQALLARYSGQTEFIVGTPVSGRTRANWGNTVGYFVNVLPLLTRVEKGVSGRALALLAQASALDALEHQDYPFVSLVERLAPARDPSRSPIFDVMFVFERPHLDSEQAMSRLMLDPSAPKVEWAGMQLEGYALAHNTAQFDLVLMVVDSDERFSAQLTYNSDLFSEQTGSRLARHFAALLEELVAHPEDNIWKLGFLNRDERRDLVSVGPTAEPSNEAIHALIEQQVARSPDAPAVVFGNEAVTYRELDSRAQQLAIRLRRAGARPDALVAICLERDISMLVAMFAVLKSGAAYVPVDPDYPAERQLFVVTDAQPSVLVTTNERRRKSFTETTATVVSVDEASEQSLEPFHSAHAGPHSLAYVIYTSGSTGTPKGVMVTHQGVANFFAGMDDIVQRKAGAWLAITSVSFDISVLELLWTLTRGMKVVIQRADGWSASSQKSLDLGIMFWGQDDGAEQERYRLFLEVAKQADSAGFSSLWIPERHFHAFGGNYPNPSVLAAAAAVSTKRIAIRSGSVVLPLQNPLRVVEEWAVVDNLSNGRVALSIASGWHKNDFVLAPTAFDDRARVMLEGIELMRHLWRGGSTELPNGKGEATVVKTLPRPVQAELPIWLTAAGRAETFRTAGERGFNVLTHLLGQDMASLAEKIAIYREARKRAGHGVGHVTLMLHSFVHEDADYVRRVVREPFTKYLEQSVDLFTPLYRELGLDPSNLSPQDKQTLLEFAFERYFSTSGLFGTPASCRQLIAKVADAGVDEIACLVEFGIESELVLDGLRYLAQLLKRDDSFAAQVQRHGITHLQCTPSTARMLLDTGASDALRQLDTLLVGGEALPGPLARSLSQALPGRVTNMYGPTETSIWSSSFKVAEPFDAVTSIGSPLRNTTMYVVDEHLELVPPGVRGELCIGGEGVSQGYFRRPELTAERFVPDKCGPPGARVFRTGDIVRRLADGTFQFLGRNDHQVKVRGFRVELGEIEAALERHPSIGSAATRVQSDGSGDQMLVAYVVGRGASNTPPNPALLRAYLSSLLPGYMVPSAFVILNELPRTPNGKIDRTALKPLQEVLALDAVPPRDTIEHALCLEWGDVLGVSTVGIDDDFFSLGGHSLMATRLRARLAEHFGVELSVADLFRATTVRTLAELLRPHQGVAERAALLVEVMAEAVVERGSAD